MFIGVRLGSEVLLQDYASLDDGGFAFRLHFVLGEVVRDCSCSDQVIKL